jgi:HEAT repeat protein
VSVFRGQTITFEAALRDVRSPDARVRALAADALADVAEAERPQAVAALVPLLRDERHEIRATAAIALGVLGDRSVVPQLVDKLVDGNPQARQAAAIALGRLGDPAAFDALAEQLREGPADLRFQAARSLAEIDPARAFEPLCAALGDRDAEVRGSVAEALSVVGDARAAGWLAPLLEDKRLATRFAAAMTLAILGDARGVDVLLAALGDDERAYDAIEGLELAGDARAVPRLVALASKLFGNRLHKVRAAGAALQLAPQGPEAAAMRTIVEKASRTSREDVRGVAEELLARPTR